MDTSSAATWTDGESDLYAPIGAPLRMIEVERPARDEATERAIAARWAELRAGNPRLFDGAIWSVQAFDAARGRIEVARDHYAALAARPRVPSGACLLAVTGIVRRERAGRREVLLARRRTGVFAYPGRWEFAPAGGVECAVGGAPAEIDCREQLCREGVEEFQLPEGSVPFEVGRVAGVVHDREAASLDVVFWCEAGAALEARLESSLGGWECDEARWVGHEEASEWVRREPEAFIPPSRLLMREIAWAE